MVELTSNGISEIEKLMDQSVKGHHVLFDHKQVAEILKTPTEEINFFTQNNMQCIQEILTEFLSKKSFYQKQHYLDSLDHSKYELLVRTYFHILDNTVMASLKTTH